MAGNPGALNILLAVNVPRGFYYRAYRATRSQCRNTLKVSGSIITFVNRI